MTYFFNVFSKDALSPPAHSNPQNWRCELGTFWKDIEEAGSIVRAIRLRRQASPLQGQEDDSRQLSERGSATTYRWMNFRTLRFSIR